MKTKIKQCSEQLRSTNIKVAEKGRSAVFKNPNKAWHDKTRFDGCVVNNEIGADYVVTKHAVGDVIVELKGGNVPRGVEQVLATARIYADHKLRTGKIAALIVAKSCPKFDNAVRRGKEQFARQFRGPLHVVNSNEEYVFESVLDFKGPLHKT